MQGADMPFYLLWNRDVPLSVRIAIPKGTTLKQLHNVESKSLRVKKNEVYVSSPEVPGYLGGVFSSQILESPSEPIVFSFELADGKSIVPLHANVDFFRPEVHLEETPKEIRIHVDQQGRIQLVNGLRLANRGLGTGIVRVEVSKRSEVRPGPPKGVRQFAQSFNKALRHELLGLEKEFPRQKRLLEWLRTFAKDPKARAKEVKPMFRKLDSAVQNNEHFRERLSAVVISAYVKNFQLLTDVDAFLTYLKSTSTKNLILLDPLMSFNATTEPKLLSLRIRVTDLAHNGYPVIRLPNISLVADKKCEISSFQILTSAKERTLSVVS